MRYLLAMLAGRPMASLLAVFAAAAAFGCASLEGARLVRSGNQALDRGDVATAIVRFEEAVTRVPEAAPAHNNLGVAYLAAGRTADAERAFERAVALDCSHEPAQRNLRALRGAPSSSPLAAEP